MGIFCFLLSLSLSTLLLFSGFSCSFSISISISILVPVLVPGPDAIFSLAFRDTGFMPGNGVSQHVFAVSQSFPSRDTGVFS